MKANIRIPQRCVFFSFSPLRKWFFDGVECFDFIHYQVSRASCFIPIPNFSKRFRWKKHWIRFQFKQFDVQVCENGSVNVCGSVSNFIWLFQLKFPFSRFFFVCFVYFVHFQRAQFPCSFSDFPFYKVMQIQFSIDWFVSNYTIKCVNWKLKTSSKSERKKNWLKNVSPFTSRQFTENSSGSRWKLHFNWTLCSRRNISIISKCQQ